jgi:hypothetical protein
MKTVVYFDGQRRVPKTDNLVRKMICPRNTLNNAFEICQTVSGTSLLHLEK